MRGKKVKIGVMGSASGPTIRDATALQKAQALGEAIAKKNCICITGACPGLPDKAAEGANRLGGFVMGISPAFSKREHLDIYGSPIEHYDMILFSGLGLMERDIINIRSCDAVVVVGGGVGTLNEFTVAYEEQKPVGILEGCGGISEHIGEILDFANRKAGPDRVLYDSDPARLVDRLIEVTSRVSPPLRESDIGGEKEAGAYDQAESARRKLRREHDIGQKNNAEKESS
jgi:uncharacterized protein (TIGR00725 family)